jgi:hypothetical protein
MLRLEGSKGVQLCDGLTRRDFLRVGALSAGTVGLSLTQLLQGGESGGDRSCILLLLVGGPSQLDTWDLKPAAPEGVRSPFRPIRTNVPGIELSEHFPRMATMADRFSLVRSVHHTEAPVHETGHQLMQTGRLFRGGQEHPHVGAVVSRLRGPREPGVPSFVVVPGPIGNTGVNVSHGQTAGYLGDGHAPIFADLLGAVDGAQRAVENSPQTATAQQAYDRIFSHKAKEAFSLTAEFDDMRARYGHNTFGQSCLLARRLVESGVRLVTVNMFETVFNQITWDCHADGGSLASSLDDYRETLCPMFDLAYTTLLEDLAQRGLLEKTLVVAMGEFGRTPQLNPRGGRDHWPSVWTILLAGGGVRGGRVIGSSDRIAAEPRDRPVTPPEVAATMYRSLGIEPRLTLESADGRLMTLADAAPIDELF